ncbi:MAG: hypothetical protein UW70_C0017G0008 [Candidatus Peregrinibacteria bacterium GW2011_GWA2_44_7]|nr:MAG: hypothetical protein UW70_C0017G0008 [Candidatus Peregrinibacteria bacterium GW2011_GWA2_44_7]
MKKISAKTIRHEEALSDTDKETSGESFAAKFSNCSRKAYYVSRLK